MMTARTKQLQVPKEELPSIEGNTRREPHTVVAVTHRLNAIKLKQTDTTTACAVIAKKDCKASFRFPCPNDLSLSHARKIQLTRSTVNKASFMPIKQKIGNKKYATARAAERIFQPEIRTTKNAEKTRKFRKIWHKVCSEIESSS